MIRDLTQDIVIENAKNELLALIKQEKLNVNIDQITKAIDFAKYAHTGQYRYSSEPFVTHPIAVAKLMVELHTDTTSIILALLHDTVEDKGCSFEEIKELFGSQQAELVRGITKLKHIGLYQSEREKQAENFRKLLLAISKDVRVLLVKLADRLHNIRTLKFINDQKKRMRIAQETVDIYAPLAERIGLNKFKDELQNLAFMELHSEIYSSIAYRLDYLRHNKEIAVEHNVKTLQELLNNAKITAEVCGREKTIYSIWHKMEEKKINFEKLSDITAFRILVPEVEDCYRALMVVHTNFAAIPGTFQDHISAPKMNGYSSLHTTVIGSQKRPIEIQIRTHKMHETAEFGIASHWYYKQNSGYDIIYQKYYKWIKKLNDTLRNTKCPDEILENTKLEMDSNQIFCFSPKGDFIGLPKMSTPIDFAFAIDASLGLKCKSAKINGHIVPLKTQIENGDQVEIIASDKITVLPSWEYTAVTAKAKTEIRYYLHIKQCAEFINIGRAILIKTIKSYKQHYNELDLIQIMGQFKKEKIEDLLVDIGKGIINPHSIVRLIAPNNITLYRMLCKKFNFLKFNFVKLRNILKFKKLQQYHEVHNINLDGVSKSTPIHLADCCNPLPKENIVGLILQKRGIVIHLEHCEIIENLYHDNANLMKITWNGEKDRLYIGKINVIISNECGALAIITDTIARDGINLHNLQIIDKSVNFFDILLELEVHNILEMNQIMDKLRKLSLVYSVERHKCN